MRLAVPDYSSARVLVVGDVMLDRYWTGPSSRISPEAPVPVVRIDDEELRPGGAGNVMLNVLSLGGASDIVGVVGDDEHASILERVLHERGGNCDWVVDGSARTVTKLRVLSRHQQLIRLDFEDGFPQLDGADVMERAEKHLHAAGAVILSDYGKGSLRDIQALIQRARQAGKPVLIDPKGNDFSPYRGASVITPNLSEFEAVVGPCTDEDELVRKGLALLDELALEAILITRSEHGMSLLRRDHEPLHLPTRAQDVFDVTGAGDTVIATLAAGLAAGLDWAPATALANVAAGLVVAKLGTATITAAELDRALHGKRNDGFGMMSEDALVEALAAARANGERVVMTNGCFDILHAGHVAYLAQARALGDRLIVAVNDDDSVRRLGKGEGRPINALEQRMQVMAALESVDWVLPFSEDTPQRLICKLAPDLLVKGGDYKPRDIAGYDCVTAAGGEVRVLDFLDGCSTSSMIEQIKGNE